MNFLFGGTFSSGQVDVGMIRGILYGASGDQGKTVLGIINSEKVFQLYHCSSRIIFCVKDYALLYPIPYTILQFFEYIIFHILPLVNFAPFDVLCKISLF